MYLILQLKAYLVDSQNLLRDLLIVCQVLEYCQRPLCIFVTLQTGSVVRYNPSENQINISKEIHSQKSLFSFLLTCIFFKYFSNDTKNTHMIIVLPRISVALQPKSGTRLAFLFEICLFLHNY